MVAADDGIGQARRLPAHRSGGGPGEEASVWLVPAALCALAAFFLYLPALRYALVFDDLSLLSAEGPRALGTVLMPYRPLRYLSYRFDYLLGGGEAWIYHLVNIVVHSLLCALSAALAYRLGARRWTLLLAGLLPATHPLAVEAVAYVSGRRDLLAALFGTAALLAWTGRRYPRSIAAALLLAAVAAKESALVFVPLLALASLCGIGPRKVFFPLACVGGAASALLLSYGAIGPWFPQTGFSGLRLAASVLLHYLKGLSGLARLNVEYPKLDRLDGTFFEPYMAAAAMAVLLAACVWSALKVLRAARSDRGRREEGSAESGLTGLFASCWVLLNLVALSAYAGLHEPGADRHAYPLLISLGVAAALVFSNAGRSSAGLGADLGVSGAPELWKASKPHERRMGAPQSGALAALRIGEWKAAVAAIFLVLAAWSLQSSFRMEVWRDEHSLWSSAVAAAPGSARARHNWAVVLAGEGELQRAMKHERRALSADPSYTPALIGRAALLCSGGRPQRARKALELALAGGAAAELVQELGRSCELPEFAVAALPDAATVAIAASRASPDAVVVSRAASPDSSLPAAGRLPGLP